MLFKNTKQEMNNKITGKINCSNVPAPQTCAIRTELAIPVKPKTQFERVGQVDKGQRSLSDS